MSIANPERGEATIRVNGRDHLLRPSFTALVAAEGELGPLFALVERAGEGRLALSEIATLFWFCLADRAALGPNTTGREAMGDAVVAMGLSAAAKPLRALLVQILQGRG